MNIRRALISVWDKTGIVDFARALRDEFGIEIISTGGTAKALRDAGIPVTLVETLTGCGEMLDGRVKTLHPAIHAAILADRDNPEHMRQLEAAGIKPIDMVVVNLYPFEKTVADPNCTFEQAIEMIDIGGVALLRAAAKNHKHVFVVADSDSAALVLDSLREEKHAAVNESGATCAFRAIAAVTKYDADIAKWMSVVDNRTGHHLYQFTEHLNWGTMRYGENPSQNASLQKPWRSCSKLDLTTAEADDASEPAVQMSYNNYLDADAALGLCAEIARSAKTEVWHRLSAGERARPQNESAPAESGCHTAVFIKHTNPCGVGISMDPIDAYRRAYLGDPNAAMGGILAVNFPVDAEFAATVMETYDRFGKPLKDAGASYAPGGFFVEVWIAPSFTDDAVKIIRGTAPATDAIPTPPKKKWGENVRLLAVRDMTVPPDANELQYRSIAGGLLVQSPDVLGLNEEQWKVVTERKPTDTEMADLRLAWLICKHTKSNAITLVQDGKLLGNGAGQMSRVMSCRIATWLARENGHLIEGTSEQGTGSIGESKALAAASDAFFPFADGPKYLIDAGVTAIIQPGGSKRDDETIALCNERGIAMIMTGTRHFRH